MPELPGIGFEAKSDLITVMRALAEYVRLDAPAGVAFSASAPHQLRQRSGLQQPHHDDQR